MRTIRRDCHSGNSSIIDIKGAIIYSDGSYFVLKVFIWKREL